MDYRRFYQPGSRYFFTVVTEGRQPVLIDHIGRLRDAFRLGMSRRPFAVDAIVVLPDHLHSTRSGACRRGMRISQPGG